MIIAIDPGVRMCGVALFHDSDDGDPETRAGRLYHARWVPVRNLHLFAHDAELVVEMPRIYRGSGQQKGDLNDLLDLATVVGYCEGIFHGSHRRVFPAQWKGQVPKKIMNARVLSRLDDVEKAAIVSVGAKDHNILDAIGIGLWALGRLG